MLENVARRLLRAVFGGGSDISVANPLPVTSEVGVDSGTATDGSNTTLEDTAKSWQLDIWEDAILEVDIGGIQYTREIDSNTADTLTFAALPGVVVVAAGCPYRIKTVAGLTVAVSSGNVAVVSGEIHVMSGQVIAKVSGETVIAKVSGEVVQISGQVVKVSGETVIAKVSGETVVTSISGNVVGISGETVIAKISGETVIAKISGETVIGKISGEVVQISGQVVKVSGETVIAKVSGETVVTSISGNVVGISGETVIAKISGETVIAKISGETVSIQTPTMIKTGPVRTLISASGGEVLHSGAINAAVVKALSINSGVVLVGGSGDRPWYEDIGSAQGLVLAAGEAQSKDINNFDAIYVVAQVSGDKVCFEGVN